MVIDPAGQLAECRAKGHLYSASSQGPQMRYVGRDGSMVT